ncbi:MAG: glycoside hydrolase family 3 protein [Anaerolineae bacterium]|nr:glycoside hydrolase family 3 protein [Anaerolineae bacterium]
MTAVRDQLGYKMMLAFEGMTVPERIRLWLAERPTGGVTYFLPYNVRTPQQVRHLSAELQAITSAAGHPPLIIATDQEGGQLNALGAATTQFAGNMALGATRDTDLAQRVAAATGREMAAMGINVNYAPNLDINTNPDNSSCGIRSFGDQSPLVTAMAHAYVTGIQSAGVAATIKHFPGSGDSQQDSHFAMPLIDHSLTRLNTVELPPFQAAIDAGARLVMTGHFAIPVLAGTVETPATLSRAVVHDFVRGTMGFKGVVISDALDMAALTQGAGQIIDVIAAVRAEVDLLLTTNQPEVQERIYQSLRLAHRRALFSDAHVTDSVQRILALKHWIAAQTRPEIDVVGCADHQLLAAELARRSLTLVRNDAGLLPLQPAQDARLAVIVPQPQDLTPADTSSYIRHTLAEAMRSYHPSVDEFVTAHKPTDAEIAALREKAAHYDLLIVGTIGASMNPAQTALAQALLNTGVPTVTVALRTPYDIGVYPQAQTHVATYSILPPSMRALAAALWGQAQFEGQLPVSIPDSYAFGHGLSY